MDDRQVLPDWGKSPELAGLAGEQRVALAEVVWRAVRPGIRTPDQLEGMVNLLEVLGLVQADLLISELYERDILEDLARSLPFNALRRFLNERGFGLSHQLKHGKQVIDRTLSGFVSLSNEPGENFEAKATHLSANALALAVIAVVQGALAPNPSPRDWALLATAFTLACGSGMTKFKGEHAQLIFEMSRSTHNGRHGTLPRTYLLANVNDTRVRCGLVPLNDSAFHKALDYVVDNGLLTLEDNGTLVRWAVLVVG